MKRLLALLLSALLCFSLLTPAAFAEDLPPELVYVLTADKESIYPGDEFHVVFTVERKDSTEDYGISTMQNEIEFDADVFELTGIEQVKPVPLEAHLDQRVDGSSIVVASDLNGRYSASEVFCILTFQAKSTASAGTWTISNSNEIAYDVIGRTESIVTAGGNTNVEITVLSKTSVVPPDGPGPGPDPGGEPVLVVPVESDIIVAPVRPGVTINGEGKRNPDGSIDVTVWNDSGKVVSSVPGGVRVIVPNVEDGQVVVRLNEQGEIIDLVEKSLVENHTAYTLLPGTARIRIIDNAKPFEDVRESDWYNEFVIFASSHELFIGVDDTHFAPYRNMSRAMMVTVLWRLEDRPEADSVSSFTDMERNSWYDAAVDWAAENGVVLGYSDEEFGPRDNVTREQMATLLYRYLKDLGFDVSATGDYSAYADGGEVSAWASEAMHWAIGSGMLIGRSDTILAPRGTATRAEVATMFKRLVTMMVKP